MNSTAVSYGTSTFRAIGSCLYGLGDLQPEKRLMFAILLDAVECFQEYTGHEANRLFKETEEWIFKNDHEWPYSFINICEAVDMDPKYLRKGLLQWKQRMIFEANICRPEIVKRSLTNRSDRYRLGYGAPRVTAVNPQERR